jgi:hypothetical protein
MEDRLKHRSTPTPYLVDIAVDPADPESRIQIAFAGGKRTRNFL